jgi:hypothetical protein
MKVAPQPPQLALVEVTAQAAAGEAAPTKARAPVESVRSTTIAKAISSFMAFTIH